MILHARLLRSARPVAALLLAACGPAASAPPVVPAGANALPAPALSVNAAPAETAAPAASAAPAEAAPAIPAIPPERLKLAVDLLQGEEHVIAYSPATGAIVYAHTYEQEGTGTGCTLVFLSGGKTEEVEAYTPGPTSTERIIKEMAPAIAERLVGFVAVKGTAWQKSFAVPAFGFTLRWESGSIVAHPSGKKKSVLLAKVIANEPHVPRPTFVYLTASPVLVVEILHDPGAKYTQGYNTVTTHEVVKLPPELSTPAAGAAARP